MDIDAQIRERIKAVMAEKGIKPAALARAAHLSKQNFGFFLSGRNKSMGWDKYMAIERSLGTKILPDMPPVDAKPPDTPQEQAPGDAVEGRSPDAVQSSGMLSQIPVVDLRRVELSPEGADMFIRVQRVAHAWIVAPVSDPEAFAAETKHPVGDFKMGEKIIISPATRPLPGNWCAIQVGTKMFLAEYLEIEDRIIARISSGQFHKEFRLIGTAVGAYRSLLG